MANVNINAAEIASTRYNEQESDVAAPAPGYFSIYLKEGGLYWIDDAGVVAGPLGSYFAPSGRLTLTTATPVTTADVSAAETLYYTPYTGNMISLFDGARWIPVVYTEKSLALGALTASKPYDIFGYLSSGTLALEALVWTNGTTRATALAYQDGRLVKSGATTRLYLGTIYINSSGGQTDDSITKRNVWNYYNRVPRRGYKTESTNHTYTTGSFRPWNNDATQIIEFVTGVIEDANVVALTCDMYGSATVTAYTGVGYNVTNDSLSAAATQGVKTTVAQRVNVAAFHLPTSVGLGYYSALEFGATTCTFSSMWMTILVRA